MLICKQNRFLRILTLFYMITPSVKKHEWLLVLFFTHTLYYKLDFFYLPGLPLSTSWAVCSVSLSTFPRKQQLFSSGYFCFLWTKHKRRIPWSSFSCRRKSTDSRTSENINTHYSTFFTGLFYILYYSIYNIYNIYIKTTFLLITISVHSSICILICLFFFKLNKSSSKLYQQKLLSQNSDSSFRFQNVYIQFANFFF